MSMAKQVLACIEKYNMIRNGDKVLVAVSGGPDSMALLHILYRLKKQLGIELHVFHLNHMFREEAAEEARLVEQTADNLGIPCTVKKYDVQNYCEKTRKSKQEGAREVRYDLISQVSVQVGANSVAQGHHGDDQVETMFLNFIRGSGLTGLKGFLPVRDNFYIRPLINHRRRDIEDYCRRHNIPYKIDSSNEKPVYMRNKLRLEFLPRLEEYKPELVSVLLRTAEVLREEDDFLESEAVKISALVTISSGKECFEIDIDLLLSYSTALQRRVLRRIWNALTGEPGGLDFEHLETVLELLNSSGGRWEYHLPRRVYAVRKYGSLILKKAGNMSEDEAGEVPYYCYLLKVPGETYIPELDKTVKARILPPGQVSSPEELSSQEAVLDYDRVGEDLYVRRRRPGDRFSPLGLSGGEMKLKKFFIDQKVPREERDKIPLVICGNDIIWIAGIRPSEKYKYTGKAGRILYLCLSG